MRKPTPGPTRTLVLLAGSILGGSVLAAQASAAPTAAPRGREARLSIASPVNGNVVAGQVQVAVAFDAGAAGRLTTVELWIDDLIATTETLDQAEPRGTITLDWDTVLTRNGEHRLKVKAYAGKKLIAADEATVTVHNGGIDVVPPLISFYAPLDGQIVSGNVNIGINAADNDQIALVGLFVNRQLKMMRSRPPFQYTLDTSTLPLPNGRGTLTLEAWAYDRAENRGIAKPITIQVLNRINATPLQPDPKRPATPKPAPVKSEPLKPEPPKVTRFSPLDALNPPAPSPATKPEATTASAPSPASVPTEPAAKPSTSQPGRSVEIALRPSTAASPKARGASSEAGVRGRGPGARGQVPSAAVRESRVEVPAPSATPKATSGKTSVATAMSASPSTERRPSSPSTPRRTPNAGTNSELRTPNSALRSPTIILPKPSAPKLNLSLTPVEVSTQPVERPVLVTPSAEPTRRPTPTAPTVVPPTPKPVRIARTPEPTIRILPEATRTPAAVRTAPARVETPKSADPVQALTAPPAAPAARPTTVAVAPPVRTTPTTAVPSTRMAPSVAAPRTPAAAKPMAQAAKSERIPLPVFRLASLPRNAATARSYTIQRGDTLRRIALRHRVTSRSILVANGLTEGEMLHPGRRLAIPGAITIALNDEPMEFDVQPRVEGGVAITPFRQIFEHTGGIVRYVSTEGEVQAHSPEKQVTLKIGSREALVNSAVVLMDRAAFIDSGRTMVPVKFMTEALDLKAEYDVKTGAIYLLRK